MRLPIAFCLLLSITAASAQEGLTVPLPPGQTSLLDLGLYRVGYQSYGGQPVWMPESWVGHFEPVAGISYLPGQTVQGRPSLLLHSPWHLDPGRTWVDYRLKLPRLTPVTFTSGVAMGAGLVAPEKSDGVTFSAFLNDRELLRKHVTAEQWEDLSFDLSSHAGETVTVRLQVEPGPNNSPSFDYSYWGAPTITCGNAAEAETALAQQLAGTKAYRVAARADLRALSNRSGQGVAPGNLLAFKNAVRAQGGGYDFTYSGADCRVAYRYTPRTGTLTDFTCQVDGGASFRPADGGGVYAEQEVGDRKERVQLTGGRAAAVKQGGGVLQVRWEYPVAGGTVAVDWTFGIRAKALTVAARCDQPVLVGLSLGRVGGTTLRRMLAVPYLPSSGAPITYLPASNLFAGRYLNWMASHASTCPQGEAGYERKTDGTLNTLAEEGYVAVSPCVDEVLPNIPWKASPYLKLLGDRLMLDIWGQHDGTFAGSGENLRDLKDNGIDHVAIINHVWQRWGYDAKLPDHVPADPGLGGDEGMIAFGKAANDGKYVWSLHENYIDLYPDAPSYDAGARVLRADGSPSPAWFNRGTGVQSFGLKCNRAKGYAEQNAPYIHKTYGTNAAYLDVHTCVPPWHQLDHEANQPLAAMAAAKVKYDGELFQYMREAHQGPLFGEGNNQFYWAGQCDGVEAQVSGGENHTPFLDLDLLKIHPQMVNHGMGYYERWFTSGYDGQWGRNCGTVEQLDKYRAQTIAYGHAAFIGSVATDNVQWVAKEHHLLHPLQALYGTARPTAILYEVGGKLLTASIALAAGDTSRQCIKYDSGLTLYVNWSAKPWTIGQRVLPQWGFTASGPKTQVYTCLDGDRYADYAECPEYVFVDARTSFDMPYARAPKDIEPRLKAFQYLGDNRIRVTYEWLVNDTIADDQNCFVHFTNPAVDQDGHIVFQQDHHLAVPTSQWKKGDRITDGPYEITIPDEKYDSYNLTVGLWKGPRVALKGIDDGASRIIVARLQVKREGGRITGVALADLAEVGKEYEGEATLDFGAHLNPPGTMIDFGAVATDGSVKINREANRLVIFPYPRDREFTLSLYLPDLVPNAKLSLDKVQVHALAAGTQADLGQVPVQWGRGHMVFKLGLKGAGRYVVSW